MEVGSEKMNFYFDLKMKMIMDHGSFFPMCKFLLGSSSVKIFF